MVRMKLKILKNTLLPEEAYNCDRCTLSLERTKIVPGVGNKHSAVVFLGEAPGTCEDELGQPFVGRSGILLNKMLESIGLSREDVFITNTVKCRPPNNRPPTYTEKHTCSNYLDYELEVIQPKIIVGLGLTAGKTLNGNKDVEMRLIRGHILDYNNKTKYMITYHPAALLRNPSLKHLAWEDLQALEQFLKDAS